MSEKTYEDALKEFRQGMQERMKTMQRSAVKNFRTLNAMAKKGGILFTGSSLMEMFPIAEMAMSAGITRPVYNRGIGGTTTDDFLREIDTVMLDLAPSAIFINIGTNDMNSQTYGEDWMNRLMNNYETIIRTAREKLPDTVIYMMAYYPANLHLPWQKKEEISWMLDRTPENIAECNRRVKALADKYGALYIDVNEGITDENGEQKAEYAIDGVHMYASGYEKVFERLLPILQTL